MSAFPKKSYSDVSRFILPRMCTSAPNLMAPSDVSRLFTVIGYLAIQVACFNAILDCIANMIGRLLDLHIVESTPCNQAGNRQGFLIFDLTFTSHFMFSYVLSCSVKFSVRMTFCISSYVMNTQLDILERDFTKP